MLNIKGYKLSYKNIKIPESGEKITLKDLTDKTIIDFQKDCASLNNLPPDYEPRATEHIPEMINMIENLILNEFARKATIEKLNETRL